MANWAVAPGWSAFVAPGNAASSCLNENKNLDNVHSGHRYRIEDCGATLFDDVRVLDLGP